MAEWTQPQWIGGLDTHTAEHLGARMIVEKQTRLLPLRWTYTTHRYITPNTLLRVTGREFATKADAMAVAESWAERWLGEYGVATWLESV